MDDFNNDSLAVDVLITFDDGGSWTTIVNGLTNTSIQWNSLLGPNSALCRIHVFADDSIAQSSDDADAVFTILNPTLLPSLPWWWIAAIAVVIIIVVIIVIYLLMKRRGASKG